MVGDWLADINTSFEQKRRVMNRQHENKFKKGNRRLKKRRYIVNFTIHFENASWGDKFVCFVSEQSIGEDEDVHDYVMSCFVKKRGNRSPGS